MIAMLLRLLNLVLGFLVAHKEAIEAAAAAVGLTSGVLKFGPRTVAAWKKSAQRKELYRKLNANYYSSEDVIRATTRYIEPDCQVLDPTGSEDFRRVHAVRQSLFTTIDNLLFQPSDVRYTLLLADTGMGKTSFLLNYAARHWGSSRRSTAFRVVLIPLSSASAVSEIKGVTNKAGTVIFLDAFDEDTRATLDHRGRLLTLLQASTGFRHCVVTCRTQFFAKDDEIPRDVGVVRVGPIAAGSSREQAINKLYLSPFSEEQIHRYIRSKFPLPHLRRRRLAMTLVNSIQDLAARPMLLDRIEDILELKEECRYSSQIYEQMIKAWLVREKGLADPVSLRGFCECLAVDIYSRRRERNAEKISEKELGPLGVKFGIPVSKMQEVRTRSLLNRDADGNLKFAHRSIMEYLVVTRFRKDPSQVPPTEWTDQMKQFFWEMAAEHWERDKSPIIGSEQADLGDLEQLRLRPIVSLRSTPRTVVERDVDLSEISKSISAAARDTGLPHLCRLVQGERTDVKYGDVERSVRQTLESESGVPSIEMISDLYRSFGREPALVMDHALGLVWEIAGAGVRTPWVLASARARALSELRFAGHRNWRLPTTDEAASLCYIARDPDCRLYFTGADQRVWTSDKVGVMAIGVDLSTGSARLGGLSQVGVPRTVCVASIP